MPTPYNEAITILNTKNIITSMTGIDFLLKNSNFRIINDLLLIML